MKLTVLVDNNTLIDRYFTGEPGLCFHIQDGHTNLLLDVGYSDIFIGNANKMKLSLRNLDYLVLSHSHLDHTWGLEPLIRYYTEMKIENIPHRVPVLMGHTELFKTVAAPDIPEIGCLLPEEKLRRHFEMSLERTPQWISENLVFLGEIPRVNSFEGTHTFGRKEGADEDDPVPEDSALVYKSSRGLVVITGCSHSGICNIAEYAREVCREERVYDIIGGFHLLSPSEKQIQGTMDYFRQLKPHVIHPCHCTDLSSKIRLASAAPLEEVGVGLILNY